MLTSTQLENTYAVSHDTSIKDGGTEEQAHRAGLLAVDARARHDYESARPAVSDEELAAYITQQIERRTSVTMSGLYLVTTPGVLAQAILRTVRERLEP